MARGGNPPLPHSAFCCVPASHNGPHYANGCQLECGKCEKCRTSRQLVGAFRRRETGFQTRIQQQIAQRERIEQRQRQFQPRRIVLSHRLNNAPQSDASTEITSPQRQRHSRGH